MRVIKILLWLVGIFVVLLVGAAIAIPLLFEPNDFKPQIQTAVKEQTGRELTIAGDIDLKVFPWLAVTLGETRLANAEGFGDEPMAEVQNVRASIKLLPLLRKNVEIGKLSLDGLVMRLARDASGKTNWQDLEEAAAKTEKEGKPKKDDEKSSNFELSSLTVAGLDVSNSRVVWADAQAGARYELKDVEIETGQLELGKPVDLELAFSADSSEPAVSGDLAFDGKLVYDLEKQQYAANGLKLTIKAAGAGIPVTLENATLTGDVSADMQKQLITVAGLTLTAKGEGGEELPVKDFSADLAGSELLVNLAAQTATLNKLTFSAKGKGDDGLPVSRFAAKLSGGINANLESQQLSIAGLSLTADADGQGDLPVKTIAATLTGDMDIDMAGQTLAVAGMKFNTKGKGTDAIPAKNFDATLDGDLSANLGEMLFSLLDLKAQVNADGKDLPGGAIKATLTGEANANMKEQSASLSNFVLQALDLKAVGTVAANQLDTNPTFTGAVTVDTFNPRELMAKLKIEPPVTNDPNVLKSVSFRTQLAGGVSNIRLQNMELNLDDTRAAGSASVADFSAPSPAIGFDLVVDKFNADRYLAPTPEQAAKKPGGKPKSGDEDVNETPVDLSFLEPLNINGKAKIGELRINNLDLSNVNVGVQANNGLVQLEPLALQLYGGSLQGDVQVDVRNGQQKITAKQQLAGLQFEPFTRALMDDAKVAGIGNLSFDISTAGKTVGDFRQQLNGDLKVSVNDGAVLGFNIGQFLRQAKARFSSDEELKASASQAQKTDFASISASAKIINGVLTNPDLLGASPALRLLGEGNIDLAKELLNYKTNITIVETSKGQGGGDLSDLKGFAIPVEITGSFSDPKIKLNIEDVLKQALAARYGEELKAKEAELKAKLEAEKARFAERRAEEEAKLKAKLNEKLNNELGGALGGQLEGLTGGGEEGEDSLEDKAAKELERGLKKLFR